MVEQLAGFVEVGFDVFNFMLDHESQDHDARVFAHEVIPMLRDRVAGN